MKTMHKNSVKKADEVTALILDTFGIYGGHIIESAYLINVTPYEVEGEFGKWVYIKKSWRFLYPKDALSNPLKARYGEHHFICLRDETRNPPSKLLETSTHYYDHQPIEKPSSNDFKNKADKKSSKVHKAPTPKKKRKHKYACPVCREKLMIKPPLICPNCNSGISAGMPTAGSKWPTNRARPDDYNEGEDGRHFADEKRSFKD